MSKAETDALLHYKAYWLDPKTGKPLVIESENSKDTVTVYRDPRDRRRKMVWLINVGEIPLGYRFQISVTELRERYDPMGFNPIWLRGEKRWMSTKESNERGMAVSRAYKEQHRSRAW